MTARARKKPLFIMPPLHCQIAGCGAEYAAIGDYADTLRAAELGGWRYCIFDDNGERLIGAWVCPDHRHVLPWWPGRRIAPPLPVREPGATTAEFLGVVPPAALPAPQPLPSPAVQADIREALAAVERGETESLDEFLDSDDLEPLPPLPQRKPAGPPEDIGDLTHYTTGSGHLVADNQPVCGARHWIFVAQPDFKHDVTCPDCLAVLSADAAPEPQPGGTIYQAITPEALAGGVPLGQLAPEQEDEGQA